MARVVSTTTERSPVNVDDEWATLNGSGKGENAGGGWHLRLFYVLLQGYSQNNRASVMNQRRGQQDSDP
jgi:hypothetical protein